jgi:hypothetical protein
MNTSRTQRSEKPESSFGLVTGISSRQFTPEALQIREPVDDALKPIIELLDLQFIYDEVIEFRRLIRSIGPHE